MAVWNFAFSVGCVVGGYPRGDKDVTIESAINRSLMQGDLKAGTREV
jgi:hypothetical protein